LTVSSVLFDKSGTPTSVEADRAVARTLKADQLLWVDILGASDQLRDIGEALEIPEILWPDDETSKAPSMVREQGWIRLTVVPIQNPGEGSAARDPIVTPGLRIIAGTNVVITIHEEEIDAIDALAEQFRDEPGLGVLAAADLVAGIVDEVLAIYLRHVEVIERRIDVLDELAIRGRSVKTYLGEVVALRRRIALLRRALAPHREAFGPLARPDFEVADLGRPWPGLVERLEATTFAIQNVRELLIGSVELQQSSTAERANDVMKRLTMVNAILLPAIVLAGIMGMNFQVGFFDNPANFWIVIGAMAALAIAIVILARVRGWL
jgi:magnesium transporter